MAVKIGCIGGGNIVRAMLSGVKEGAAIEPGEVGIYDINQEVLDRYAAQGFQTFSSIADVLKESRVVLVAVLPQVIRSIVPELAGGYSGANVLLSVPPGVTCAWYAENVGADVKAVQCTPTLTAQVGMGAYSIDRGPNLTDEDYAAVTDFLSTSGIYEEIPADLMNEVTPFAGCAPAYFYHMGDIILQEAEKYGLDPKAALNLFAETMKGSAEMLLSSDEAPKDLEKKLLLPGAATLFAINKMVELGFDDCLREGIAAGVAQCRVLGDQ